MKFLVTDREGIGRGLIVQSSYIVISIHDPDKPRPRVPKTQGSKPCCGLHFMTPSQQRGFACRTKSCCRTGVMGSSCEISLSFIGGKSVR